MSVEFGVLLGVLGYVGLWLLFWPWIAERMTRDSVPACNTCGTMIDVDDPNSTARYRATGWYCSHDCEARALLDEIREKGRVSAHDLRGGNDDA